MWHLPPWAQAARQVDGFDTKVRSTVLPVAIGGGGMYVCSTCLFGLVTRND
jgi:hypothetical protein